MSTMLKLYGVALGGDDGALGALGDLLLDRGDGAGRRRAEAACRLAALGRAAGFRVRPLGKGLGLRVEVPTSSTGGHGGVKVYKVKPGDEYLTFTVEWGLPWGTVSDAPRRVQSVQDMHMACALHMAKHRGSYIEGYDALMAQHLASAGVAAWCML